MRFLAISLISALSLHAIQQQKAKSPAAVRACREFSFDGRVNGGEEYSHRLGEGLWLRLSPLTENWGWVIQVHPEGNEDDFAYPLNPPFHSDNSQYLGTGYGDTVEYHLKHEHDVFFTLTRDDYQRD